MQALFTSFIRHFIYMCRNALRMRYNTIGFFVIQRDAKKWRGILQSLDNGEHQVIQIWIQKARMRSP